MQTTQQLQSLMERKFEAAVELEDRCPQLAAGLIEQALRLERLIAVTREKGQGARPRG